MNGILKTQVPNVASSEPALPSRRRALILGATGALALTGLHGFNIAAFAQQEKKEKADSPILTPEETEGPYWIEEKLKRSDVRIDPTTNIVEKGLPLTLNLKVSHLQNGVIQPLKDAYVDIWHCNASGQYSDVQQNGTSGKKFLRGYQITDDKGQVQFTTVYPGWYQGRTVHIHARIRTLEGSKTTHDFTTQMYFDESVTAHVYKQAPYSARTGRDTFNSRDGIFSAPTRTGNVTKASGELLMLKLVEDSQHAVGKFDVLLDLATIPAQSRGDRGPGGPGGSGGPGGQRGGRPPFGPPPGPPPGFGRDY